MGMVLSRSSNSHSWYGSGRGIHAYTFQYALAPLKSQRLYVFWNIAKDYKDLKVIIGVDCHDPILLGSDNIRLVEEFKDELGIKVLDKLEY